MDRRLVKAAQWVGCRASLVYLADDRRSILGPFAGFLQRLQLLCRICVLGINAPQPQGAFDRYLPVAERSVLKDLRLLALFEADERVADPLDVLVRQFAVLLAQV